MCSLRYLSDRCDGGPITEEEWTWRFLARMHSMLMMRLIS